MSGEMPLNKDTSDEEAGQKLGEFIVQELQSGSTPGAVTRKLVKMGVEDETAEEVVGHIHEELIKAADAEQPTSSSLMMAILGGLVAAVVGAGIWGGIVIATDYEVGFVAWLLGGLSGFAVVLASGGKRGLPLQIIAVLSSIAGILLGKYVMFHHAIKSLAPDEQAAETLSLFSMGLFKLFIENLGELLGGFDALWALLAVTTAWSIPKASGFKRSS